jgi:prepilin-type N-terminal cleavage/methylation domain-containing protein
MRHTANSKRGFTLLELMISATIGLIVIGGAVSLFTQALKATWITSEKGELQQDFRAAAGLLQRDISMAGAGAMGQQGLAYNAVGLPNTATRPVYPCSTTTCNYINGAPVAYPNSSGAPYIYSIIPGPNVGITVNAASGPTDIISLAIADVSLELNCYTVKVTSGTTANFGLPSPLPPTCILPTGVLEPPSLLWTAANPAGLQAGDMVMFGTNSAMGVVTNVVGGTAATSCYTPPSSPDPPNPPIIYTIPNGNCFTVTFTNEAGAAPDPGHVNQPNTVAGILDSYVGSTALSAVRMLLITYYLDISPSDGVTPRLMRIQNGRLPSPVAENVSYLKFTYDVNNNGTINANVSSLPVGTTPAMITQVNIAHMTMRSQLKGGTGYQGLDLQTSIAARNLTSQQEYPISGSAY